MKRGLKLFPNQIEYNSLPFTWGICAMLQSYKGSLFENIKKDLSVMMPLSLLLFSKEISINFGIDCTVPVKSVGNILKVLLFLSCPCTDLKYFKAKTKFGQVSFSEHLKLSWLCRSARCEDFSYFLGGLCCPCSTDYPAYLPLRSPCFSISSPGPPTLLKRGEHPLVNSCFQ